MANEKFVTLTQLGIVKGYIDAKDEKAIKSAKYEGNVISLYTTEDKSGSPAVTLNLPEEMYLDQTKTTVVDNFAWSDTLYPGSTNPNLDGKSVLVLAVKGDSSTTYSFASLGDIVTAITGEATSTTTTTVSDGKAKVDVKISSEADNALETKADGLYVNVPSAEVSISSESGNSIVKKADGLYVSVPEITVATDEEVNALFS